MTALSQKNTRFVKTIFTTATFLVLIGIITLQQTSYGQINHYLPSFAVDRNVTTRMETIEQASLCQIGKGKSSNVDLLILIPSSHQALTARQAIRSSYATSSKNNTSNVRYIFVFGQSKNKSLNIQIDEERKKHSDIYQDTFVDNYENITLKVLSGFKWVIKHCNHAKYVMKADTDTWVNVPKVLTYLNNHSARLEHAIGGTPQYKARPLRDPKNKWYTPYSAYPGDIFPDYCSGPAYITTTNVVQDIVKISKNVPFFKMEDVYMGMCLKKLNYRVTAIPGFCYWRATGDTCKLKRHFLTSHYISPKELIAAWNSNC